MHVYIYIKLSRVCLRCRILKAAGLVVIWLEPLGWVWDS